MRLIKLLLVTIFTGFAFTLWSQDTSLEKMIQRINTGSDDTLKVNLIFQICDSLYPAKPAVLISFGTRALEISRSIDFLKGEAFALKYIGMGHLKLANYVKAIDYCQRALDIFETIKYKKGTANILSNLGVIYTNEGDYAKALELYIRSFNMSQEINDSLRMVTTLNNIGLIYAQKENSKEKAREYYLKALRLSERMGYSRGVGTLNVNMGELLFEKGYYKQALKYFERALEVFKKYQSGDVPYTLMDIGKVYSRKKDYSNAIRYLEDALVVFRQSNSKLETGQALIALADTYLQKGETQKAIDFYKQSEQISDEIGASDERKSTYGGLAKAYARLYDFTNAYQYQLKESTIKDTIFSENSQFQINQLQIQYETASMFKENEILKRDAGLRDARSRQQKIIIFFLVLGFISILLFLMLLAKANKKTKTANVDLKATLDIVNSQKKLIEAAHGEIRASINYARYIQASVLPKTEQLEACLEEHFVIYKPVEIVSGDFYWVSETGHYTIIAVADCTGHGVPGAFMSMLGMTLLNEIVNKDLTTDPGIILDRLRQEIIASLKQKGERWEQKDGLDISLCTIDRKNMKLQFAGAENPLYIIREKVLEDIGILHKGNNDDEWLIEIKGDPMPVGITDEMQNFMTHEIDIQTGDRYYMFSDGFADQFGGSDHKRLSYKRFREQILRVKNESMATQKLLLDSAFEEWKGASSQTDDILVVGFRIN